MWAYCFGNYTYFGLVPAYVSTIFDEEWLVPISTSGPKVS